MVYVAILGHGVVGSGVAEVMRKNADSIAHKAGEPIEIRRILDLREFPDLPYADKFTKEFDDILHDPDIRIVVETMGGLHPAYDFVKSCLLAGKNVVTSNKELVAAKGDELLEIAKNNNLNFLFEASVGGGIPILRPIDQCLAANEVYEIAGILNGTTNFVLTKMWVNIVNHSGAGAGIVRITPMLCSVFLNEFFHVLFESRIGRVIASIVGNSFDYLLLCLFTRLFSLFTPLFFFSIFLVTQLLCLRCRQSRFHNRMPVVTFVVCDSVFPISFANACHYTSPPQREMVQFFL